MRDGVLRLGGDDGVEDFESFFELVVIEESAGQAALGVDVVGIEIAGAAVGGDGFLVLVELIVAGAESELDAGAAVVDGHGAEYVGGALGVALLAVEARHVEDDLFGVGVDLLRGLELLFSLGGVVIEAVELAEEETGLYVVGLELGELLVFGDGKLEHLAGLRVLHVSEGAEIDFAEELVGFDVVGVAGDLLLRGGDGFLDAADLEVEVGEAVLHVGGVGVGG